jgi:hypothetical protein
MMFLGDDTARPCVTTSKTMNKFLLKNLAILTEKRYAILLSKFYRKTGDYACVHTGKYRSYTAEGNQRKANLQLWITTCLIESDVPILRHPSDFTLSPLISITPCSTSLYNMPALCSKIHEAVYVISPSRSISMPSFLQPHPPTRFLLPTCHMPIYP